jgi:hypothetical protein
MSKEIALNKTKFKHALVTDIELKNGTKTQVVTIFNSSEVNFEEMVIGIDTAIDRQAKFYKNIKATQHNFSSIKKEGLKQFAWFQRKEFN